MLDPIRTSEVTEAVAAAAAAAQAEIEAATVRRVGEDNPSDPVVALEGRATGKAETRKLRVTVTISAKVDPPENREVAWDADEEVEEYEWRRATRDAAEADAAEKRDAEATAAAEAEEADEPEDEEESVFDKLLSPEPEDTEK